MQISNHCSVSSLRGHKIHEWLTLLDREVKHIWQKEWNVSKILFIISRYGLLLDMPLIITCKSDFIPMYRWGVGNTHWNFYSLTVHIAPYGTIDDDVGIGVQTSTTD